MLGCRGGSAGWPCRPAASHLGAAVALPAVRGHEGLPHRRQARRRHDAQRAAGDARRQVPAHGHGGGRRGEGGGGAVGPQHGARLEAAVAFARARGRGGGRDRVLAGVGEGEGQARRDEHRREVARQRAAVGVAGDGAAGARVHAGRERRAGPRAAPAEEEEGEEGRVAGRVGGEHAEVVAGVGGGNDHRGRDGRDREVVRVHSGPGRCGEELAPAAGGRPTLRLDKVPSGVLAVLDDDVGPWARVCGGGDGSRIIDTECCHVIQNGEVENN